MTFPGESHIRNLWMIDENDGDLEQIIFFEGFDRFPMFIKDGKHLAFASNRYNLRPGDINMFIADRVD